MTTTARPPTTPSTATQRRSSVVASEIVCFGTLAWIGYVWLIASAIYAIVIASVVRWGSVDESLWMSVAAGWQRYVVFACGVTVATTYLRMLVRNGGTRRALSTGATVTMVVLALIVAAWTMLGLSIEHLLYDRYDWPQALRSDTLFTWGDLPRAGIDTALVIAVYYACGWIVGCGYVRSGALGGTLRVLPALVPIAAMELLVTPDFGSLDIDALASWSGSPPLALTLVAGVPLVAATAWVGRHLCRGVPLR